MHEVDRQLDVRFSVPFAFPVRFAANVFAPDSTVVAEVVTACTEPAPVRALCVLDDGLVAAHPGLPERITAYARRHAAALNLVRAPLVLTGGEAAKNSFAVTHKIIRQARRDGLCRHSALLAVGGGAFLDAAGLAAALVHRGVRLIRFPTTVLAQADSGVGVKNGVNLGGSKNFVGTFAPPAAVINDSAFLSSLSDRDWCAGTAEAFKVGVIKNAAFLEWLLRQGPALRRRDLTAMEALIRTTARLHAEHIMAAGDPFEFGSARPLDFGHWAAHKLESLTLHELRHGEAVGIGMALDLLYAARLGFIAAADARRVLDGMVAVGLPLWHEALEARDPGGRRLVFHGIEEFRQHLGGALHVTLPRPLGQKTEVEHLDEALLESCLDALHARQPRLGPYRTRNAQRVIRDE